MCPCYLHSTSMVNLLSLLKRTRNLYGVEPISCMSNTWILPAALELILIRMPWSCLPQFVSILPFYILTSRHHLLAMNNVIPTLPLRQLAPASECTHLNLNYSLDLDVRRPIFYTSQTERQFLLSWIDCVHYSLPLRPSPTWVHVTEICSIRVAEIPACLVSTLKAETSKSKNKITVNINISFSHMMPTRCICPFKLVTSTASKSSSNFSYSAI